MQDSLTVQKALERLQAIDWHSRQSEQRRVSNAMLMREYLRREDMWRDELVDILTEKGRQDRFFDIPLFINPLIRAPQDAINTLDNFRMNRFERPICAHYLHWAALENAGETSKFSLPAPYEPIIMIFERGGWVYRESMFIQISPGMALVLGQHRNIEIPDTVKDLDIDYLNELDFDWES